MAVKHIFLKCPKSGGGGAQPHFSKVGGLEPPSHYGSAASVVASIIETHAVVKSSKTFTGLRESTNMFTQCDDANRGE
jgi:hypothetical protein